jgi:hypothetical protein
MSERRQVSRHPTLKGARIVFNHGQTSINCLVSDLSAKGALLHVETPFGIPDVFDLALGDGAVSPCHIARRNGKEIGVEFEDYPDPTAPRN